MCPDRGPGTPRGRYPARQSHHDPEVESVVGEKLHEQVILIVQCVIGVPGIVVQRHVVVLQPDLHGLFGHHANLKHVVGGVAGAEIQLLAQNFTGGELTPVRTSKNPFRPR